MNLGGGPPVGLLAHEPDDSLVVGFCSSEIEYELRYREFSDNDGALVSKGAKDDIIEPKVLQEIDIPAHGVSRRFIRYLMGGFTFPRR